MSLYSYFNPVNKESLFGEALQSASGEISSTQICVARELNAAEQEKEKPKKRQIVPEKIKREVGFHANKHGIAAARKWATEQYRSYTFEMETVRDWRNVYRKKYVEEETTDGQSIKFGGP